MSFFTNYSGILMEACLRNFYGMFHKNMPNEYSKNMPKGRKTTHISSIAKLTPMSKYTKIQKKVPTTKTTQNALKYKAKTLYY